MNSAMDYLNQDFYLNYPLIKAIEHGFEVIHANDRGVLVTDSGHVFALLSAANPLDFLPRIPKPEFKEVIGQESGIMAQSHFGFENALHCHQYYYPFQSIESDLELETAKLDDLDFITQHYALADEEELRDTIEKGYLWAVRDLDQIFAFIGRQEDGSMGMMEVLPEYRRKGWGERLGRALIKIVLSQGELPYGHVLLGNEASARLQEKLGLVRCKEIFTCLW